MDDIESEEMEREERLMNEFAEIGFMSAIDQIDILRKKKDQSLINIRRDVDRSRTLVNQSDKIILSCNIKELINNLRSIYETYGKTNTMLDLLPEDNQTKNIRRVSSELFDQNNGIINRFLKECICQKKE